VCEGGGSAHTDVGSRGAGGMTSQGGDDGEGKSASLRERDLFLLSLSLSNLLSSLPSVVECISLCPVALSFSFKI